MAYTTSTSSDTFHLFIIHDGYSSTPEVVASAYPFTLYPNPVKDQLSLTFADGIQPEEVKFYDAMGKMIEVKCTDLEHIDMGALPAGFYMMCVTLSNGERRFEKVVKE